MRTLIKDPRGPGQGPGVVLKLPKGTPIPALAQGIGAPPAPYIQPGPWKIKLIQQDVIGVWLAPGVGAAKQYFFIRKVGEDIILSPRPTGWRRRAHAHGRTSCFQRRPAPRCRAR